MDGYSEFQKRREFETKFEHYYPDVVALLETIRLPSFLLPSSAAGCHNDRVDRASPDQPSYFPEP